MSKVTNIKAGWRVLALGAAGVVAVAGCGSSGSSSAATSTTTAGASTTGATSTTVATPSSGATTGGSSSSSIAPLSGGTGTITGPGVTATEIKLGQIATVSGPVPGLFQNAADSLDAFAAYVNSQGGIDGKKLVIVHKDDAYDCDTYTNDLKSLATQVFAMVGTFSVEDGCGESVLQANPTLPNLEAYIINPELFSIPNAFASEAQPPGYLTTGYQWVKDKYGADITHTADLYPATASFSYKAETGAAKSIGYKYVYTRGLGTTETSFTSDILRMKADGVKVVDLGTAPVTVAATFEQEAAQQNFHPDAVLDPSAYDSHFFELLGSNTKAADNLVAPLLFPLYLGQDKATNPELATYLTWLGKTHSGDSADLFGTSAWAAGVQFAQAVQKAGATVTRSSLIQATTNLGNFTADGLLPGSDPGKRIGPHCMVIAGVANGQFTRLDPTTTGFECNGVYDNIPLSQLG